jgi:hypothetical protein
MGNHRGTFEVSGKISKRFSDDFRRGGTDILIQCCDGIEIFFQGMEDTKINSAEILVESLYRLNSVDSTQNNPYQVLGNFFKFIHVTYIEKYRDLLGDFIDATNSKRYLSVALCGRSIIEATASLRFYNNAVMKKVRISSKKDLEGIDPQFLRDALNLATTHMHGSKMNWGEFFTSDKKTFVESLVEKEKMRLRKDPPKREDYIQSLPVYKFLDSWFDEDPELIALAYNFYSELVHPNLGSNLLLTGVAQGKVQVGRESNRSIGKTICREAVTFIAPILKEASRQLVESLILSSLGNPIQSPAVKH